MNLGIVFKGKDDVLDYDVDFDRWLSDIDYIKNVECFSSSDTVIVDKFEFSERTVKIWVSGGVINETAHIDISIKTDSGIIKHDCFSVRIRSCTK